jgi:hypothetical protein
MLAAHRALSVVIVLLALVGTLWGGYVAYRLRAGGRLGSYGWLMTAALVLQACFGIVLAAGGSRPQDALHFVFGPLSVLALPGARWLAAARGGGDRVQTVVVAAGWALTLGLSLRAVGTGGGVA